jgi:hypothetical protein
VPWGHKETSAGYAGCTGITELLYPEYTEEKDNRNSMRLILIIEEKKQMIKDAYI